MASAYHAKYAMPIFQAADGIAGTLGKLGVTVEYDGMLAWYSTDKWRGCPIYPDDPKFDHYLSWLPQAIQSLIRAHVAMMPEYMRLNESYDYEGCGRVSRN